MRSSTALNLQTGVLVAGHGFFPSLFNLLFVRNYFFDWCISNTITKLKIMIQVC